MFTGIVTELGTVKAKTPSDTDTVFTIHSPVTSADVEVGDSIAVNGVCLTATAVSESSFECVAVGETLSRTSLGVLQVGDRVNLERPMPADGRFDGHIVQGHVDGIGTITSITHEGQARRIRINLSTALSRHVVEKGSIALDGTSLTVTAVSGPDSLEAWVEVVLIPHTLKTTTFGSRKVGDSVNVEVDVIAKYVERMMGLDR